MKFPILFLPLLLATSLSWATGHDHPHAPAAARPASRAEIRLLPEEREHLLLEMRQFLAGVQTITRGVSDNDMKSVAAAARSLGMAAAHEVPAPLRRKLPVEFRQLGSKTHQAFDDLARDAESLGDPKHSLLQLADILQNCVACHASFRFTAEHVPKR